MSEPLRLKVGDLEPAAVVECLSAGSAMAIDSAIGATFVLRPVGSSTPTVSAAATILDDGVDASLKGRVSYSWQAGDTDTAGTYQAEVVVEWTTGREQTFPGEGFLIVKIEDDLA